MADEFGLLDSIREQPDADDLRRIYADWLEDNGDSARAEFVRLQVALARLEDDHPARPALLTRELGLLLRHQQSWALDLLQLCDAQTFRRGFVEEVVIQRPLSAVQYNELFRFPFVRRICVPRQAWRLFPGLIESPGAARLEELHIASTPLDWSQTRDLFNGLHFQHLHRLELISCQLGQDSMQRLSKSPLLPRLRTLILRDNPLDSQGILHLIRSPGIRELKHLDLSECGADADVAHEMATLSMLGRLTTLHLRESLFDASALLALLASPHLGQLADLDLAGGQYVGPEAWQPLFTGDTPSPLRRLSLARNHLYRTQLFQLLSAPRLAGLRWLDLSAAVLHDDGGGWARPAEWSATPLDIDLSGFATDVATMEELLSVVPAMRRVRRLGLRFMGGEQAVLDAMFDSPHLCNLVHLDLGNSTVPEAMLDALANSGLGRQLTGLDLSRCYLGDDAAAALADFPQLANLTHLSLRNNYIGPRGARALALSPHLRKLQVLDLSNNQIDDEGAGHLAQANHLSGPIALKVGGNHISGAGRAVLLGAAVRAFERGVTIPHLDA